VYAQVLSGEVDLGLVAYPARRPGLQSEIFDQDEMVLICHPNHPLARHSSTRIEQLNGEKFIAFEPDVPTRKVIDRHLRASKVEIEHTMEFDNIETVKRAVEIESGISIVPLNTVRQEVGNGVLAAVKIDGPKLSRPLGVITNATVPRSPAQKEFLAALRGALKERPVSAKLAEAVE
jgi:DNA-binding transcriptional LysR family regulator